jgi:TolB-like protein/Tfp pilus assembly protein PilF
MRAGLWLVTDAKEAVFLSYASQDAAAAARLCDALRSAGIEVWFDQSELRGGEAWDRQIRRQIRDCAVFMPLISAHSQARLEGYFRREWRLAVERAGDMADEKAFLLPVTIDDTSERQASVPEKFREVQWTHLPSGNATPEFLRRVGQVISGPAIPGGLDAPPPSDAPGMTARSPASPPATARRLPWPALAMFTVLLTVAGGYFAWRHSGTSSSKAPVAAAMGSARVAAAGRTSIAVLPFLDMSEKRDQEYFTDGMAEEILNILANVPTLKVIGRTSSFQFKGKTVDLRSIGEALGAAYLVEGSVRRSGDRLRVTAQLIDTSTGTQRWSQDYDRELSDALKVQAQIAASVARALQIEIDPSIVGLAHQSQSTEAYDLYLRGQHAFDRGDQAGAEEATIAFRRAWQLEPSFVPAAASLAEVLDFQAEEGWIPPAQGSEEARKVAMSALQLDPRSAIAHAVLGSIHVVYDWDWAGATRELDLAVKLAPNNPDVLDMAFNGLVAASNLDEALQVLDTAESLDPLASYIKYNKCTAYQFMGRLTEAERACRRALEISPDYAYAHYRLVTILLMLDRPDAAMAEAQLESSEAAKLAALALAEFAAHRRGKSDAALARLERDYAEDWQMEIAGVHAYRGEPDLALQWLDRAYAHKHTALFKVRFEPMLKSLHGDPRFNAFLGKMKLQET